MQLIVFEPDGSIEYTRNPLADALFEGERKRVVRMSEILFDEDNQKYFIKFLTGTFAGLVLAHMPYWSASTQQDELYELFKDFWFQRGAGVQCILDSSVHHLMMRTYEDAVRVEVAFVTFLREQGYSLQ